MFDSPLYPTPGQPIDPVQTVYWVRTIFTRVEISDPEKLLWLWLVSHCVFSETHSCVFTYQQLADVMRIKPEMIHRALIRLRMMGFLLSELPLLHGIVTPHSAAQKRLLTPTLPELEETKKREGRFSTMPPEAEGKNKHDFIRYE